MKTLLFLFALASLCLIPTSSGQTLLMSYNGTSTSPAIVGTGFTGGNLSTQGNVTITPNVNFPSRNFGYETDGWPTGETPPLFNSESISFTLTADEAHEIELTRVEMWFKSSGRGPDKVKLQLTVSTEEAPFNVTVAEGVLALSNSSAYHFVKTNTSGTPLILQPTQTATFYIVGFDAKGTGDTGMLITDIEVYGSIVPEPSTTALFLLAGAFAATMTYRRNAKMTRGTVVNVK